MLKKNALSVITLFEEMKKADRNRSESYSWIYLNCSNQADLAKIKRKSKSIVPVSLNTFKKYCNEYIEGGFDSIDSIREKLNKCGASEKKITKVSPADAFRKLERRIDELERSKAILIKGYNDLNEITLDLLSNSEGNSLEYRRHKELYSKYFGLSLVVGNNGS
jgi:predicted  nucleic acid-binding Zn-ribbon protein